MYLFICLLIIHLFGVIMVVRAISSTFQSVEFITVVLVINNPYCTPKYPEVNIQQNVGNRWFPQQHEIQTVGIPHVF